MCEQETELIYADNRGVDYLSFTCGKCKTEAKIVKVAPNEPNMSTDLRDISILGIHTECPKCRQEGMWKINLSGVKIGLEID